MSDKSKQSVIPQKSLEDLTKKHGNNFCADCSAPDPNWIVQNIGIFVCEDCAGIHRNLGTGISRVRSLYYDKWEDHDIQTLESLGNKKAKAKFEANVPDCYRCPKKTDPFVLREQWIKAKYQRLEFRNDPDSLIKLAYLSGHKEGYMNKKGKEEKKFNKRKFVLDEQTNRLSYFNKEDAKEPKAVLLIDKINVSLVPEKVGNPFAMQITYSNEDNDNITRSIYCIAENGQDLVEWYTAIRSAKLNRLRIAFPGAKDKDLSTLLTHDFVKEGWLCKKGPKPNDAFRKRWVTLDRRKLMYTEDPLDAYPNGEIMLGLSSNGYSISDQVTSDLCPKCPPHSFVIYTPDRAYVFSADTFEDKQAWISTLNQTLAQPIGPQDDIHMLKI